MKLWKTTSKVFEILTENGIRKQFAKKLNKTLQDTDLLTPSQSCSIAHLKSNKCIYKTEAHRIR